MTEKRIFLFKIKACQKFGDRYIYPCDNYLYGSYLRAKIPIFDVWQGDFFYETPFRHIYSLTGRN